MLNNVPTFFDEHAIVSIWTRHFVSWHSFDGFIYLLPCERFRKVTQAVTPLYQVWQFIMHIGVHRKAHSLLVSLPQEGGLFLVFGDCSIIWSLQTGDCIMSISFCCCCVKEASTFISKFCPSYSISFPPIFFLELK